MRTIFSYLAFVLLLLLSPWVQASVSDDFSTHYFGTLGLARSSSPEVDFVRDLSQPSGTRGGNVSANTDSALGIQANYRFNEAQEAAIQVISRFRYDGSYRPQVTWAYVKHSTDTGTQYRAGRLGTDFYPLADSRLVGFANLAVRPSLDFFGQLPFVSFDGFDVVHTFALPQGLLRAKLFAGWAPESFNFGSAEWSWQYSPITGANLDWSVGDWSFRAGVAQIIPKNDWPYQQSLQPLINAGGAAATLANALSPLNKKSKYYVAAVMYDHHPWTAQLMVNATEQESFAYENYRSGYFLLGYRWHSLTPYVGISRSYTPRKQLDTAAIAANPAFVDAINFGLGISHTNQTTYTLGLRWDVTSHTDMKIQWDGIRGRSDSTYLYRSNYAPWSGKTDVISVVFDFAF